MTVPNYMTMDSCKASTTSSDKTMLTELQLNHKAVTGNHGVPFA
jgi:hypothetical protein